MFVLIAIRYTKWTSLNKIQITGGTIMKKRKYENYSEQCVYENSCDCLRFGYGFKELNHCNLSNERALEIWIQAKEDMGNDN